MQSHVKEVKTSGATVVVCLIISNPAHPNVRRLHVANVGDSRAVLAVQNETDSCTARRLTYDHRAEDPEEQARITQAGGFIVRSRCSDRMPSFHEHTVDVFCSSECWGYWRSRAVSEIME